MIQNTAIAILKTGVPVFLTGEPGSGKTYTVNQYIAYLRDHGIKPAVTASTGIAATHLGGITIHSWSGIGIKKDLSDKDLAQLRMRKSLVSRVTRTHVLIIDEISMLEARVLTSIDKALKTLRENSEPFGGLQVVFVGDFFQLPPVARNGESPVQFAFESPAWQQVDPVVCYLSEQHRQEDEHFLSVLTSIRSNRQTSQIHNFLSASKNHVKSTEKILTSLYSHNVDVDYVNDNKLAALPGKQYQFNMKTRGPKRYVTQLKKGCLSPQTLILKKGARVICTKNNFEAGFVNGTLGKVVKLEHDKSPVIQTKEGRLISINPMEWTMNDGIKTLASITQIPLRLAWAITIHKSQGMTLDAAMIDLSRAFEYGQGYVAISRVRALSGLFLMGYNQHSLKVHPTILAQDADFKQQSQKANEAYDKFSTVELVNKQRKFVLLCGGKSKKAARKIKRKKEESTYDTTLELFETGISIEKIAKERDLTEETIIRHIEKLLMHGRLSKEELKTIISPALWKEVPKIHAAFDKLGTERLSPVFEELNGAHTYNDLRLIRLLT